MTQGSRQGGSRDGFFATQSMAGLARDLRAGRRTSAQLTDASLAGIERLGAPLNAFTHVDAEGARAAAARADDELRRGTDRGPLHGMPVAAGMVPLALGTDTAGSVRVPAALCGVAGFKPAYGAIPTEGVFPLAASLDHVGLFTRTSEDAALAYGCLVPHEPHANAPDARRIGWLLPSALGTTDSGIARSVRARLGASGLPVEEVDLAAWLPHAHELFDVFSTLQGSEAFEAHAGDVARGAASIDPEVLARLRSGEAVSAWRHVRAQARRAAWAAGIAALLDSHDVLALPTVPMTAPHIGERAPLIDGAPVEVRAALLSLTSPWNLFGLPALSVPAGTIGGLPIALQLVTAAGREAALFKLAQLLEGHD